MPLDKKVLILIVMDNGLLLGDAADKLSKFVGVLILIVMDNGLLRAEHLAMLLTNCRLNPYCNG